MANPILCSVFIVTNMPLISVPIFTHMIFWIICQIYKHFSVFWRIRKMSRLIPHKMLQLRIILWHFNLFFQLVRNIVGIVAVSPFI